MKPWLWGAVGAILALGWSTGGAAADTFDVGCPSESIQAAVNAAASASPSGPHTINVSGACVEIVVVSGVDNLTIQGSAGASLTGAAVAGGPPAVLLVRNSHAFRLNDMIVNGIPSRSHAIQFNFADGVVERSTIQGAPQNGLSIQNQSSIFLRSSTIQNNSGNGILVAGLSSINAQGNTITQNGGNGLTVNISSAGTLAGDDPSTAAVIERNEIAHNGGGGVAVSGVSTFGGQGAHLIHHNALSGIRVTGSSNVTLGGQSSAHPAEIYQNGTSGVTFAGANGGLFNFVRFERTT